MLLTLAEVKTYDRNPRREPNPQYGPLKASIRRRGLDQPLMVTQRPGENAYIVKAGGNTRLSILKKLYEETADERFYWIRCLFKPWVSESDTLVAHLIENEQRGNLTFIDRARALRELKDVLEQETGTPFSLRAFANQLREMGYSQHPTLIGKMDYALEVLWPAIPEALRRGMGRRTVEAIRRLHVAAERLWTAHPSAGDFATVFQEILRRYDGEHWNGERLRAALAHEIAFRTDTRPGLVGMRLDELIEAPDGRLKQATGSPEPALTIDHAAAPVRLIGAAKALCSGPPAPTDSGGKFEQKRDDLTQRRRPVAIADATPRRLAQALADAYHPLLVDTPKQQIHLHTGRLHGTGSVKDKRELQDLIQVLEEAVARLGVGQVGALTHKHLAQQVIDQIRRSRVQGWRPEDAALIGWFGRHDRGQNDWMGLKALIQWGVHRPSPAVSERLYEAERALAAQAGLHWQPWSEERAEQWFALPYRAADGSGLEIEAKMATNPDQLAWERDWVSAQVVQGIGRLRAVQRPDEDLEVHLYTHYPLAGHGLWLDQVHAPGPRAAGQQARHEWLQRLHEDSQARYDQARAAGRHSRRVINRFLKAQGLKTLSGNTYQKFLAQARAAVPEAPPVAPDDPALEQAIERVVAFIRADAVPDHRDELAALALEYAESSEDLIDRLAGRLLAYAVLAPAGEHSSEHSLWSATDCDRDPDIPLRPD